MSTENSKKLTGRMRLIQATLYCLGEYGYQDTTVRRIAEHAGVTLGLVRHHFETKDALLVAAYSYSNKLLRDRLKRSVQADHVSAKKRLRCAIRAYFPEDLNDIQYMRIMVAFWGLVLTHPQVAEIQKQMYACVLGFFCKIVSQAQGSNVGSKEIAIGIISIADGLWLECCLNPKRMTPNKAIENALQFALARIQVQMSTRA